MSPPPTPHIRRMDHHDVDAVRNIDMAVYSRPWTAAMWRHELRDPERHHLVGVREGEVVGHAGALFVSGEAHITTVAVDPEYQGQGVATLMMLDLLDEARARGVDAATLEVRSADRRAQRIYSRIGFAPTGIRPRYYSDPADDAVLMWLTDLSAPQVTKRHGPIRDDLLGKAAP